MSVVHDSRYILFIQVVIVPKISTEAEDDWETDPDYVNDVTEESQRWGGARDTGQSFSELDQGPKIFDLDFFPLFY